MSSSPSKGRPRPISGDRFLDEMLAKLRTFHGAVWHYLKGRAAANSIDSHPSFKAAREFKETFGPRDGIEYSWVCEHAKANYNMLHETFRGLDEKADTIIRHLTGGSGLLALGAVAFISQSTTNAIIALMAVPSFVVALIGVAIAIRARVPADTRMLPPVEGAVRYAEHFSDRSEVAFLGQWHEACEGMAIAAATKAKHVKQAFICYLIALVLLVFPFVGGAILKLTTAADTGPKHQQAAPAVTPSSTSGAAKF